MLHFRRRIIGLSFLLIPSLFPISVPAGEAVMEGEMMQPGPVLSAEMDPGGFCGLSWGETVEEVKAKYRTKLIGNRGDQVLYFVDMEGTPGWPPFEGPKLTTVRFRNDHLVSVVLLSTGTKEESENHLESLYGKPYEVKDGYKTWAGPETCMMVLAPGQNMNPRIRSQIIYTSPHSDDFAHMLSEKEDPDGFLGLHWGETVDEVRAKYAIRFTAHEKGLDLYMLTIPDSGDRWPLKSPIFGSVKFRDGKLVCIEILREETEEELVGILGKVYGAPTFSMVGGSMWIGPYTKINVYSVKMNGFSAVKSDILIIRRADSDRPGNS